MKFTNLTITCPHCGRVNDLFGSLIQTQPSPQPGDSSICWKCRGVAVFLVVDGVLTQRRASPEEIADLDVADALAAMNQARDPLDAYGLFQGRR